MADALDGHRAVVFPSVPRGLRLGREQWSIPWRFGAHPRSVRLLHSVAGVGPLLSDVPLVLTVPDLTYRVEPRSMHPRARWYFGSLGPRSIRRARHVIVSSQAIRQQVMDLYHIAPDRISSIPLAADPSFTPRPVEEVAAVRKRFGLPERYVLYVGTIDPRKDLTRLRAAYELLPPDLADDSALVFTGRTNRGAERLARELRPAGTPGTHHQPRLRAPRDAPGALQRRVESLSIPRGTRALGSPSSRPCPAARPWWSRGRRRWPSSSSNRASSCAPTAPRS